MIIMLIVVQVFFGNIVNAKCKEYGFHKLEIGSVGGEEVLDSVPVWTPKRKEHLLNGRTYETSIFFCEQLCLRDVACMAIKIEPRIDGVVQSCRTMGNAKKSDKPAHRRRIKYCLPDVLYNVEVKTKDKNGAGTDANVALIIEGGDGMHSGPHFLDSNGNDFERGDTNKFQFMGYNVVKPTKIYLWRNALNAGHAWMCEWVRIKLPSGDEYLFKVDAWIPSKEPTEFTISK